MIATRSFLAVEGKLAFGRKIAKDRLIVVFGGMVAMPRLPLNCHHFSVCHSEYSEDLKGRRRKSCSSSGKLIIMPDLLEQFFFSELVVSILFSWVDTVA